MEIGAFEAKNRLRALLDRVELGEVIAITRHGKPVAKLVPETGGLDSSQAIAASERIRARAKQIKPGPFDWKLSRPIDMRDHDLRTAARSENLMLLGLD